MAFVALQAQSYVKVTSAPTDWSGDYLIVYETGNVAFNGGLTTLDATSNTISVEISNDKIDATDATNAAKFTIDKNGYIKSVSGYYIGQTSDANGLKSHKTTTYKNTLTLNSSDGSVNVVSGGAYLRYNATSGQTRFRYYKSTSYTNQKAIFLYKYTEATSGGGDTEEPDTPVVEAPAAPTLPAACSFDNAMIVEITGIAEGVKIYYTTDGTDPTEESEEYVEAFEVTKTTTVKAIAVNEAGASNVATAVYTRVAATPKISFKGEATFEEPVEVTIVAADGTTAYYTLNGKTPTENSDEYTKPLTIKADVTLQVVAYDEDGYASPVVKQTFKKASVGGESTGVATLVEGVDDLMIGDNIVIVAAEYNYALSTTQNNNNRGQVGIEKNEDAVTLNDDVQILTLENGTIDGTFAFNTGSGFLYAASSSSNHLKTQATNNENGSWKIEIAEGKATIQAQGDRTRNLLKYNQTSSLFSCYGSGQEDVSIYKVNISTVEDYILDVTEAGWATMYLGYDVIIPTGVKCYVIESVEDEKAYLEEVTGVLPANTGVIVKAEEGEYAFEVTEDGGEVEKNIMLGTTMNKYIAEEAYVLGIVDGEVGLYKAAMNGGVWLNNANKAYLPVSAIPDSAQGAANYSFSFDWNGTTGIDNIEIKNPMAEGAIYDLTGRKINKIAVSGIYIIDGKKVFVRK